MAPPIAGTLQAAHFGGLMPVAHRGGPWEAVRTLDRLAIRIGVFCISPQKGAIQDHAANSASAPIRICANLGCYSFTVMDFHHLFFADPPAH